MISEKLVNSIQEMVKDRLCVCVKEGHDLMPVFLMIKDDTVLGVVGMPFRNSEERLSMFYSVGQLTYQQKLSQGVFLSDSYLRHFEDEEEFQEAKEDWENQAPKNCDPSKRKEAIVLTCFDFTIEQKPVFYTTAYTKKDDQVTFEKTIKQDVGGGDISEYISQGFLHAMLDDVSPTDDIQEKVESGEEPLDCLCESIVPAISRIIDDFPFFNSFISKIQAMQTDEFKTWLTQYISERMDNPPENDDKPWEK